MKSPAIPIGKSAALHMGAPVLSMILLAAALLAMFCFDDSLFNRIAMLFALAGIVVFIAGGLLSMERKRTSPYYRYPGRIRPRD